MAGEIESLQELLGRCTSECNILNYSLVSQITQYLNSMQSQKQRDIKTELEMSHLKVKTKLLQETLENKNRDLEELESFKYNNAQLIDLLERYDLKVVEMQTEIDIRDIRIKQLLKDHSDTTLSNNTYTNEHE